MGGSPRCPAWALLLLVLLLPYAVVGQIFSSPSNFSDQNHPEDGMPKYALETTEFAMSPSVYLFPLQMSVTWRQALSYNATGNLVDVKPEDANGLSDEDIAYICCDPSAYPRNLQIQDTLETLVSQTPTATAMVLYSTEYDYCNYTDERSMPSNSNVFSVIGAESARDVLQQLDSGKMPDGGQTWSIVSGGPPVISELDSGGASQLPGDLPGQQSGDDRSPTSSVAMIVLYSVTGLITALFLSVIVTGAVRAHRHPERYGPRNVAGRPRQSRARGIARAMLETLPIVKFGDLDEPRRESQKPDVEMVSHDGDQDEVVRNGVRQTESPAEQQREEQPTTTDSHAARDDTNAEGDRSEAGAQETGRIGPASPGSRTPNNTQDTPEPGNLGCPICADNFVKGQDVRLLPCNHKFHPECVDPWLVNVSGTCPLCRIDLRPSSSGEHTSRPGTGNGDSDLPPPLQNGPDGDPQAESHTHPRGHRRLSEYIQHTINAMPMRDSTMAMAVEHRLDTSARHRNSQHGETGPTAAGAGAVEPATTDGHEQSRRARLSRRVRDRFRIRTRRHGEEATAQQPSNTTERAAGQSDTEQRSAEEPRS